MYLLVYGLSLPPSPSSTLPHTPLVLFVYSIPQRSRFLEMYAFLNGYPVLAYAYTQLTTYLISWYQTNLIDFKEYIFIFFKYSDKFTRVMHRFCVLQRDIANIFRV